MQSEKRAFARSSICYQPPAAPRKRCVSPIEMVLIIDVAIVLLAFGLRPAIGVFVGIAEILGGASW